MKYLQGSYHFKVFEKHNDTEITSLFLEFQSNRFFNSVYFQWQSENIPHIVGVKACTLH